MDIKIPSKITVKNEDVNNHADALHEYINHMKNVLDTHNYNAPEASLLVPSDNAIGNQVNDAVSWARRDDLKLVIVIGIGGSNLGTQAIIDGLGNKSGVEFVFLDTTSEYYIKKCIETIDAKISHKNELLINVISKSGSTTETVANFEVLYKHVLERFGNSSDRVVATTDEGSALWNVAVDNGYYALSMPEAVGGRFSVFTSVGLFPLTLAGIDLEALLQGARDARDEALNDSLENNYAAELASISHELYKQGYVTHNSFFFESRLESLGKWWRQLVGESLGKQNNIRGEGVGVGIVPIVSIGSVDLHSVGQLYLSNAQNIYTTFITTSEKTPIVVPEDSITNLGKQLGGKTFHEITRAIYKGVMAAYTNKSLPYAEFIFDSLTEYEFGYFMQLRMMEIMFTANLFEINAFDQPNVEDYKSETRKLLG